MKNFLLGFLMACGLTLAALCAAIMWCFAEYEEHRREKRECDSGTYVDYAKESRPASVIRMSEKEYKMWKKEAEAANAKSDCADRD